MIATLLFDRTTLLRIDGEQCMEAIPDDVFPFLVLFEPLPLCVVRVGTTLCLRRHYARRIRELWQ